MPNPKGRVIQSASGDWAHIEVKDGGCALINNVWNKSAAGRGFEQEVFVEDLSGTAMVGWRWRSPWQLIPTVVSQPQVVCGDKPWDEPMRLNSNFPFRVGTKKLTVNFDSKVRASGIYNMSFSMWAIRDVESPRNTISHEIMILTATSGQPPAGKHLGTIRVHDTNFDVYVERDHKDASGQNANAWTYVAFVPQTPVWKGPLEMTPFLDELGRRGVLTGGEFITSLEFGNEICHGAGVTEIENFALKFE